MFVVLPVHYYTGYSYGSQNIASSISDKGEKTLFWIPNRLFYSPPTTSYQSQRPEFTIDNCGKYLWSSWKVQSHNY